MKICFSAEDDPLESKLLLDGCVLASWDESCSGE